MCKFFLTCGHNVFLVSSVRLLDGTMFAESRLMWRRQARLFIERAMRLHQVTCVSILSYLLFCSLNPISHVLPKRVFGEFPDILMMTAVLWPYPLLLALQRFVQPDSWFAWGGALFLGLTLIVWLAPIVERILGPRRNDPRFSIPVALIGWPLLLVLVELAVFLAALMLGWPIGE